MWVSIAITIILVVVAYLILNRNITKRTGQQAALDDIKREVGAIITELNSTTERNIELIEDRIATLDKLVEQADKRVGALRRDLSTRESESLTYSRLGRPGSAGQGNTTAPANPPSDSKGPDEQAAAAAAKNDSVSVRQRVRGLYLQGLSLERIASIVGKTVGEVELIVSLDEGSER